jgi:hypothetical protein
MTWPAATQPAVARQRTRVGGALDAPPLAASLPPPPIAPPADGAGKQQAPNVMIIVLDAVSRLQVFRKLPLTVAALERLSAAGGSGGNASHELFQFFRYHITGFSTGPNTMGLFSGGTDDVVKAKPGPMPLWTSFAREGGYVSALVAGMCEDWPARYAHYNSPVDHEFLAPVCVPEAHPVGHPYGLTDGPYSSRRRCVGDKYVHRVALDYARSFWANYAAYPRFASVTLVEGHEGTGDVLDTIDADLAAFVQDVMLARHGARDTLFVLASDHGLHMGPWFLWTAQGAMEHAQGTLFVSLPAAVREVAGGEGAAAALRDNQQRLMGVQDVHATLRQVLTQARASGGAGSAALDSVDAACTPVHPVCSAGLTTTGGCSAADLKALRGQKMLGQSLFRPLADTRSCADAGMALDLCRCAWPGGSLQPPPVAAVSARQQ